MGDISSGRSSPARAPLPNGQPKSEVRILMLHGYTQSGPLFRAKTRALEKLLIKSLAPFNLVPSLIYPTAPNRLSPRDIPGFMTRDEDGADGTETEIDSWAWYRKDDSTGSYRLLEAGMMSLAGTIAAAQQGTGEERRPIDGVIGFSQGGSMAAMLAAAMENSPEAGPRQPPPSDDGPESWAWVQALRDANGGVPLKFAVSYSGFYATPPELAWLYEPKLTTPTLHYIGSLDTVVDESRSRGLIDRCEDPAVVVHPGGHFVPISKEWAMPLIGFIRKNASEKA